MKPSTLGLVQIMAAGLLFSGCYDGEDEKYDIHAKDAQVEIVNQLEVPIFITFEATVLESPMDVHPPTRTKEVPANGSRNIVPDFYLKPDNRNGQTVTVTAGEASKEFYLAPQDRILVINEGNFP